MGHKKYYGYKKPHEHYEVTRGQDKLYTSTLYSR